MKKKIYLARPELYNGELAAIASVFNSGFLAEGKVTRRFEDKISSYVGANYGLAFPSCAIALYVALLSADVKGRQVIVPDFTHPSTIHAILLAGGIPLLVDVDVDSRNITRDSVEGAISVETRCVLPVSLFGKPLDLDVYNIGKQHSIPIVEDAACSLGANINGRKVGSIADVTCFSFHARKIITTGEGGMITTNRSSFAKTCRSFKTFSVPLSNISAAIGTVQIQKIEKTINRQRQGAKIYNELLRGIAHISVPEINNNERHIFQTYTICFRNHRLRNKAWKALWRARIEAQIGSYAIHLQPEFRQLKRNGKLQNSTFLYRCALALPLHHLLTQEDQERICKTLRRQCRYIT